MAASQIIHTYTILWWSVIVYTPCILSAISDDWPLFPSNIYIYMFHCCEDFAVVFVDSCVKRSKWTNREPRATDCRWGKLWEFCRFDGNLELLRRHHFRHDAPTIPTYKYIWNGWWQSSIGQKLWKSTGTNDIECQQMPHYISQCH